MSEHTETGVTSSESLPKLDKRSLWIGFDFQKKGFENISS